MESTIPGTPSEAGASQTEELLVMSERVLVLTDASTTEGRYEVFEISGSSKGGVPLHRHAWDEEFHVLEGSLEVFVFGKNRRICTLGHSLRVPSGVLHSWRPGHEGVRFLSITSPGGVSALFRAIHQAGPSVSLAELVRLNHVNGVETFLPRRPRSE